eukprot:TRINITY_DN7266_c0_g1_i1.p1 TRINITY_DN7266_c0_g1~~TRINITY_DN7266_c0_g1_i1.p1  ORF type:complete len:411 (+),score=85.65 TRINITY_DN7266_c0_g1_i1:77-1309(+)
MQKSTVCLVIVVLMSIAAIQLTRYAPPTTVPGPMELPPLWLNPILNGVMRFFRAVQRKLVPPLFTLLDIAAGPVKLQMLNVVVTLNVPDLVPLGDQGILIDDLARQANVPPHNLYRIMRALASYDIFLELPGRRFLHSDISVLLRSDSGQGTASAVRTFATNHYDGIAQMLYSVRTGEAGFPQSPRANGLDYWTYLQQPGREAESTAFDTMMVQTSHTLLAGFVKDYDWTKHNRPGAVLADIGGGRGGVINMVLNAMPNVSGIVFDSASVVAAAPQASHWLPGVLDRVQFQAGDFFKEAPTADMYLLRWIIHDWNDEMSVRILKTIRKAMPVGGRVFIVEEPLPDEGKRGPPLPHTAENSDVLMFVMLAGAHRTMAEYRALLQQADLVIDKVSMTRPAMAVIECVAASQN